MTITEVLLIGGRSGAGKSTVDATARARLAGRERGSEFEQQVRRSASMARRLAEQAAAGTVRVVTDGRGVAWRRSPGRSWPPPGGRRRGEPGPVAAGGAARIAVDFWTDAFRPLDASMAYQFNHAVK
ncbi:hypothetical protein GCM10010400_01740 [Streptomyces aculeolatus]|uniref:hypothetical protein n=1 Tax=Streptomyces aculeolatus TaxID=270689 RepID=UPI001CED2AE9|nr:hypothetical protein [Streptomyces aculeolatus]